MSEPVSDGVPHNWEEANTEAALSRCSAVLWGTHLCFKRFNYPQDLPQTYTLYICPATFTIQWCWQMWGEKNSHEMWWQLSHDPNYVLKHSILICFYPLLYICMYIGFIKIKVWKRIRSWFIVCWPSWFMLEGTKLINKCFQIGFRRILLAQFLSRRLNTKSWAAHLTFLADVASHRGIPQRNEQRTDGFANKRVHPEREELHSAPVRTVTSAIDRLRGSTRAILYSYLSNEHTRHRRVSRIFIDIKTMNMNIFALESQTRDAIKAFLKNCFFNGVAAWIFLQKRNLVTKYKNVCI